MAADVIIKICADFYTTEEIEAARVKLTNYVNQKRVPRQKGTDSEVRLKTAGLMVKICLDPSVSLPIFCAINLNRLPPIGTDHIDVSALLSELTALRHEVRAVAQLREEMQDLKKVVLTKSDATNNENKRSLITADNETASMSFANMVQQLKGINTSDLDFKTVLSAKKHNTIGRKQPTIGASKENKHVKSVITKRHVDVFVSRLDPDTTADSLYSCITDMKGDLRVLEVDCHKLKSKYESLYSSFHVSICVDSCDMKRAIELFMSADTWPEGVFVKRYFKLKDGANQS